MSDNVLTSYLSNFDQYPFCVKIGQDEYKIGEGEPEFTVNFKRPVSMHSLMTSTSLAFGEAYMDGDLEIEGDLYHALNHFLGQMGKYEEFMGCVKSVLKPGGIFLLHFISGLKEYPGDAWIKKYIFPEEWFQACAATFMNGVIDLHQIIFTNDVNNELPMTKWY